MAAQRDLWTKLASGTGYEALFPMPGDDVRIVVKGDEFSGNGQSYKYLPLKENCTYSYHLDKTNARLARSSSFVGKNCEKDNDGSLKPGTSVGFGRLYVAGFEKPEWALNIEVASEVISYKKDYQELLTDLTSRVADLQMKYTSSSGGLFKSVYKRDKFAEHDVQRLFFLLGLVSCDSFDQAVRHVVEHPKTMLKSMADESDIRCAKRMSRAIILQLASSSRRVAIDPNKFGLPASLTSLPEYVRGFCREETADIPENQFVKHVLSSFNGQLLWYHKSIEEYKKSKKIETLAIDVDLRNALNILCRWLNHEFFRGISPMKKVPTASVTLQRKEGYRDIMRRWLQSKYAAELQWEAGKDIYGANQRKMSTLYEYWCFFKLLSIAKGMFAIPEDVIAEKLFKGKKKIVGESDDKISLSLRQGSELSFTGKYQSRHVGSRYRSLIVTLYFNKTFSSRDEKSDETQDKTWSLQMRPDYTIEFRPDVIQNIAEAAKYDLITYVHFDAKYKARDLVDTMGNLSKAAEDDDDDAGDSQVKKDVKHVDLLKMHSYRDAIFSTGGAYVLYPGSKTNRKSRRICREEVLPGIGAFPLSPSNDSSAEIEKFLREVANHLCDRITRWENYTYQRHKTYDYKSGTGSWQEARDAAAAFVGGQDADEILTFEHARQNLFELADARKPKPEQIFSHDYLSQDRAKTGKKDTIKIVEIEWIIKHGRCVASKKELQSYGKDPAKVKTISLNWWPPINLVVQSYEGDYMPATMSSESPFKPSKRSGGYVSWKVLPIDLGRYDAWKANPKNAGAVRTALKILKNL